MSAVLEVREPSAKYLTEVQPPLVQHFGLMATAPGGVARLRELILTLAVQGKLLQQDPADLPSSDLIKRIRDEKERLITSKVLKRERDEPTLGSDDLPFEIPASWRWVALGSVIDIIRGITFPASQKTREAAPGQIACLRTSNVQKEIEWDDLLFVDRSFMGREDQLIQHHDIVMSMANSRELVGKVALVERVPHAESTFGGFLGVLRPRRVDPRYAMAVLRTPYARSLLIDSSSQTTNIANVSLAKLRPLPFPLPPEGEQSRIVARVDELMCLCDALETKGQLEAAQHAQLVQTLLGALAASATPEELADNWQRVATHFDLLLDRPEAIDALELTIFGLALRGLLTPQDATDEPAWKVLKRVADRRGRHHANFSFGEVDDAGDYPFSLPPSWVWCTVDQVATVYLGGTPQRQEPSFWSGSVPWVSSGEVANGRISETREKITLAGLANSNAKVYPKNTVLIAMIGQGKTRGQSAILDIDACTNQNVAGLVLEQEAANPDYIFLWALHEYVRTRSGGRGGAQPALNGAIIRSLRIPLPPLAEQARIVARVESLRRLCADLRQRLAARQTTQTHLADALIQSASV